MKKWLIGLFLMIAIPGLLLVLGRNPQPKVIVEVLDYVTGLPVTNAAVEVAYAWTTLPIDRIPVLHPKRWIHRMIEGASGMIMIPGFGKWNLPQSVTADGYLAASFTRTRPENSEIPGIYRVYYWDATLHESPYEYLLNRSNKLTVALEPLAGGSRRAGARYRLQPSAGSKEKAMAAITRIFLRVHQDPANIEIRSNRFVNGYWEIAVGDGRQRLDISEDGLLLGTHSYGD